MYGTIAVDGETGIGGAKSGGGSGGTMKLTTASLVGRGSITSHGGDGIYGTYSSTTIGMSFNIEPSYSY